VYFEQNAINVPDDLVVPEPHYDIAHGFQNTRTLGIRFGLHGMLSAIEFDDHLRGLREKIDDVLVYRALAAKLEPVQLTVAKFRPQKLLGVGRISAEFVLPHFIP